MYALGRTASRVPYAIGALALAMLVSVPLAARLREDASSISTYRNLANAVRPYLGGDCALASYRHYVQSLPFYTHHRETRVEYWGELSEVSPPTDRQVALSHRLRSAAAPGLVVWLVHGFDRE